MTEAVLVADEKQGDALSAVVHSIEGGFYFAEIIDNEKRHRLLGDDGKTRLARSMGEMKMLLAQVGVTRLTLEHRSAYDEMVGLPAGGDNRLQLEISVPATHE